MIRLEQRGAFAFTMDRIVGMIRADGTMSNEGSAQALAPASGALMFSRFCREPCGTLRDFGPATHHRPY